MNMLLDKVTKSDVVVWSFPLYEYGIPAPMKAFIDRTNPFLKMQMKVENERVVHDTVVDMTKKKNIVICGCGFPYFEDNFSAVRIQMKNMFFNPLMLCIFEAGLVNIDNSQLAPMKEHLLDALRKAGEEYDQTGTLSDETREIIETPLLSTDAYIGIINSLVG
jgi:multimeric flavodoxin WrbA